VGHRVIFGVSDQAHIEEAPVTRREFDISELLEAVRAGDGIDVVREGVAFVLQALIEAEATSVIGAAPFERTATRTNQRNGTRARLLSTKAGDVQLQIPKLRKGSFFPAVLERRRRIDRALSAVVMEAYVHGVSTRKVDDLVQALGLAAGISKSEVSQICAELDESLELVRTRPLGHLAFPYIFLDATYVKGRVQHAVASRAVVVATGVTITGQREVLGLAVGDSEDGAFWTEFLRSLRARGLSGVRLVISDAHLGIRQAVSTVMLGAAWQRCRVHFMRNILARVPRASAEMVAAAIRTIFAQPDATAVSAQCDRIADMLAQQFPVVAGMLQDARPDLLAFCTFPTAHWRQLWSTNPLERLNREIKRRTDVVGVFPNDDAIHRLVTAVVLEQHEEWQVVERRYFAETSMAALQLTVDPPLTPAHIEGGPPMS
jgi:putative transposase